MTNILSNLPEEYQTIIEVLKYELYDVTRDPEEWITELNLLRGYLRKLNVHIDYTEMMTHARCSPQYPPQVCLLGRYSSKFPSRFHAHSAQPKKTPAVLQVGDCVP